MICLIHANIGFTVIGCHLWIQTVHIGLIRHQEFTGCQEVGYMDAVNRCRFQSHNNGIEMRMLLHTGSNLSGKLISTRLIVAERSINIFVFIKIHSIDHIGF